MLCDIYHDITCTYTRTYVHATHAGLHVARMMICFEHEMGAFSMHNWSSLVRQWFHLCFFKADNFMLLPTINNALLNGKCQLPIKYTNMLTHGKSCISNLVLNLQRMTYVFYDPIQWAYDVSGRSKQRSYVMLLVSICVSYCMPTICSTCAVSNMIVEGRQLAEAKAVGYVVYI